MKKRVFSVAALAAMISSTALGCGGQTDVTAEASATQTDAQPVATAQTSASQAVAGTEGAYADGTYIGDAVRIRYGNVQVQAVIANGELIEIEWLALPADRESEQINGRATPILMQEAIESQSAEVDVISGATMTCEAFMQSLESALEQAS